MLVKHNSFSGGQVINREIVGYVFSVLSSTATPETRAVDLSLDANGVIKQIYLYFFENAESKVIEYPNSPEYLEAQLPISMLPDILYLLKGFKRLLISIAYDSATKKIKHFNLTTDTVSVG